jgi:hypothetical protein
MHMRRREGGEGVLPRQSRGRAHCVYGVVIQGSSPPGGKQ